MSVSENKDILRRYLQLMTQGPIEQLSSVVAEDVTGFDGDERVAGVASIERHARDTQSGCPDLRVDIEQIIGEGDWVAFFGVTSGTQSGALFGLNASDRKFKVQGMAMARIVNGKIVEIRTGWDTLSFARQIGGPQNATLAPRVRVE